MNVGHVEGGTHAGWRIVKQARTEPWFCGCYELESPVAYANALSTGSANAVKKQQRGGTLNCLDCGERRPK